MQVISKSFQRLRAYERAFLLGLVSPFMLLILYLKTLRIQARGISVGFFHTLDLYRSEVFFAAGFALLGLAFFTLLKHAKTQRMMLVISQCVTVFAAFLEISAHRFYISTGSILDFRLSVFAIRQLHEISEVLLSEIPAQIVILLAITTATLVVLPWALLWRWNSKISKSHPDASFAAQPIEHLPRKTCVTLLLALFLIVGSAVSSPGERHAAFSHTSSINLALTALVSETSSHYSDSNRAPLTQIQIAARPEQKKPRNVVVVMLESTRARSVSVYNDKLETTPFLKELARKSLVAEKAYTVTPHTSKALVASLCGIEPNLSMPITEALQDGIPANCLAKLLATQGYATAFFQSATASFENRGQLIDNMGFQDFIPMEKMPTKGFEKSNYFGYEDNIMLNPGREWLKKHKNRPFFATYLTITPHHAYRAPARYPHHKFSKDKAFNHYLNSIYYLDRFIEALIAQYKALGVYDDTIFVIVGDHGEAFGEHGRYQHDNVIYEEGLHVPLMIHDPQVQESQRIKAAVSQIDIVPTLLDMLGYDVLDGDFPGFPMAQIPDTRRVFAHCWFERRCMTSISAFDKYIHHFNTQPDEYFDLSQDPLESKNMIASHKNLQIGYMHELESWRADVMGMYQQHYNENMERFVTTSKPPVEQVLDATFGDYVRLVGYTLHQKEVRRGKPFRISYVFETIKKVPADWKLFVHGVGQDGRTINLDHIPAGGLYPTSEWKANQFIIDEHDITIPPNLKGNTLKITIGFYHPKRGRAPVTGSIEVDKKGRAEVVEIPIVR